MTKPTPEILEAIKRLDEAAYALAKDYDNRSLGKVVSAVLKFAIEASRDDAAVHGRRGKALSELEAAIKCAAEEVTNPRPRSHLADDLL